MIELYDYQREAVKRLSNGNVLRGDVGSGKSFTGLAYYKENHRNKKLYIITTAFKRDLKEWEKDLEIMGIDNEMYTVDSWNNIQKYIRIQNSFFLFDEQRAVGYGTWGKSFVKISLNNKWIMLSATPGDVYIDYLPLFLANGFYKNKTEFLHNHVIFDPYVKFPKIKSYIKTGILDKYIRLITVTMDDTRTTKTTVININCDYDKSLYKKVETERKNPFDDDLPISTPSEYCQVLRRIVNTSLSRIENAREYIQDTPKIIVFYNFTYELEILRNICEDIGKPYTERNGQKHDELLDGDEWCHIVQYTAGAEGWNCIETNTILFFSLNYSYKLMHQAKGRINRVNTTYKELFLFFDSETREILSIFYS